MTTRDAYTELAIMNCLAEKQREEMEMAAIADRVTQQSVRRFMR